MTMKLTAEEKLALEDAFEALQPFYEAGNDGDGVRVALNAIAGILGDKVGIDVDDDDGLNGVLKALEAEDELRESIEQLYETASGGAYGEGLSKKDAKKINSLVQRIEKPLRALVKGVQKPPGRAKVRTKPARNKKS